MKYIMYEDDSFVMFSDRLRHKDIDITKVIASAGFVNIEIEKGIVKVVCSGESNSLRKVCNKEHDEFIIALELGI